MPMYDSRNQRIRNYPDRKIKPTFHSEYFASEKHQYEHAIHITDGRTRENALGLSEACYVDPSLGVQVCNHLLTHVESEEAKTFVNKRKDMFIEFMGTPLNPEHTEID